MFILQACLKDHKSVHTHLRSYQCHICGQMFKTPIVQRRHIQTIHYNPCKYQCSTCKRQFSSKYALKRHERIHDNYNAGVTLAALESRILNGPKDQDLFDENLDQKHEIEIHIDGDDTIDENITAIETITIKPSVLEQLQFMQQMPPGTGEQLSSSGDVNGTYIQGRCLLFKYRRCSLLDTGDIDLQFRLVHSLVKKVLSHFFSQIKVSL